MSDNWSAFASLPTKGDYIEWTFTIDATNADILNVGGAEWMIAVRCAITAAPPPAASAILFCINDWIQVGGVVGWDGAGVGDGWQDAARFQYSNPYGQYSAQAFGAGFGRNLSPSFMSGDPTSPVWIAGTNTVRVVNLDTGVQLDVDNVQLVVDGHQYYVGDDGSFLGPEAPPADYTTHVNGTAGGTGNTGSAVWVLKAPDGTTGSYIGDPTITFNKACKIVGTEYTFTIHVHDGVTDVAGDVGLAVISGSTTIIDRQTLVAGHATLTGDLLGSSGIVWYGGNADYAPESIDTPSGPINCGGWHVGRIGVGPI